MLDAGWMYKLGVKGECREVVDGSNSIPGGFSN